jgi:hypothetical protein
MTVQIYAGKWMRRMIWERDVDAMRHEIGAVVSFLRDNNPAGG